MDSRELRETFIKIYEGEESGIRAFFASPSVRLCGLNLPGFDCAVTAISPATTAVIRRSEKDFFRIIKSDSDVMYQCRNDMLKQCNERESVKKLFEAIGLLKGNLMGADILLVNSTDDTAFQTNLYALGTAVKMLSENRTPAVNEMKSIADNSDLMDSITESFLYAKKDSVMFRHKDGKYENIPFYLSDYKLIVFKIIAPHENIVPQVRSAASRILHGKNGTQPDKYEKYCINEQKRAERLLGVLKNNPAPTEALANVLKESSFDLFSLCGRYGTALYSLYSAAAESGQTGFIAAAYDVGGICTAVKNVYVDEYIKNVSDLYESREGSKPDIYICGSAGSGEELDLRDITIVL